MEYHVRSALREDQQKKEDLPAEQWRLLYKETANTKYRGHIRAFTDGSKKKEGVAIAVYDKTLKTSRSEKINKNFSITNAELLAIQRAMEWLIERGERKAVILTDSASACEILLNTKQIPDNYIASRIYELFQDNETRNIRIQWIPSHKGIKGNEKADKEAVRKTQGPQTLHNSITLGDAINLAKNETWNEWRIRFEAEEKGRWYKSIQPTPRKKIWFKDTTLSTTEKRIISRLRSGHTMTKERKAQWKMVPNDRCDNCDETENIQHLLYICPKYNTIRSKYPVLEYCVPLERVLEEACEANLQQITSFIQEAQLHI